MKKAIAVLEEARNNHQFRLQALKLKTVIGGPEVQHLLQQTLDEYNHAIFVLETINKT